MSELSRKQFLAAVGTGAVASVLPATTWAEMGQATGERAQEGALTLEDLKTALKPMDLEFSEEDLKKILESVNRQKNWWKRVREVSDDYSLEPGMSWKMVEADGQASGRVSARTRRVSLRRPNRDEDLAFLSVVELGHLLRTKQITSAELTNLYLARLKKYGPKLRCVVNLTEERAMKEARRADEEAAKGNWRGPLHGIPYGVKDLFEAAGYPTTWGCRTFENRKSSHDSDVVAALTEAGGVLVAKLSMGALAQGDVWYAGRTESPWDEKIGASGSSAGSGSAVAAGLVAFAIGTETSGSIVSPCHNSRVTGLRPSFGSVSRTGAMALCWSLDKVGPMCRDAEDCALVFAALVNHGGSDRGLVKRSFAYSSGTDLKKIKFGYLVTRQELAEEPVDPKSKPWLAKLAEAGAEFVPIYLPPAAEGMYSILYAECAAAFESFTRSENIEDLEKYSTWPNTFRGARFIPAVEYIQSDRARLKLARQYRDELAKVDVLVADDRVYPRVYALNLTGHPQTLIPFGQDEKGQTLSFSLISQAFDEARMLSVAYEIQKRLKFHLARPDMSKWE